MDLVWLATCMVVEGGASSVVEGGASPVVIGGGDFNHDNKPWSLALAFQFVHMDPKVHARTTAAATDFTVPLLASSAFFLSMPSFGGVMWARIARLNGLWLGRALRPVRKNGEKFNVIWLWPWRWTEPAWQRVRGLCWMLALGPSVRRHREACMAMLVDICMHSDVRYDLMLVTDKTRRCSLDL